jgi:hypothetical protein
MFFTKRQAKIMKTISDHAKITVLFFWTLNKCLSGDTIPLSVYTALTGCDCSKYIENSDVSETRNKTSDSGFQRYFTK